MKKKLINLIVLLLLSQVSYTQNNDDLNQKAKLLYIQLQPSSLDSALNLYKQVLQTSAENKFALGGIAEVFSEKARLATDSTEMNRWIDSTEFYADKALQIDKNLTSALWAKSVAFNKRGKKQDAANTLKHLLTIDPNYYRAARFYAGFARSSGNLYHHWYWAKKATEQEAENPSSWWEYALSYVYLNEDSLATVYWKKMLEADPKRGTGWGELGYMELLHGNTKGAVELMKKAAEIDKRELHQLGYAYMLAADKQYAQAYDIVYRVLAKNPSATMYGGHPGKILQAYLLKQLNQNDSATALANELLIKGGPNADLYLILGDKEKAVEHLKSLPTAFVNYRYRIASPYTSELIGFPPFEELAKEWKKALEKEKRKWKIELIHSTPIEKK